jgi:hypothetical protein
MASIKFSTKQLMINKANAQMLIMIAVASVVVVFSLVASRALLSQRGYQASVIAKKETALKQLKVNVEASKKLVNSYTEFEARVKNVIGGDTLGNGERDGDNAKLVLDALPSQYDFPALGASLEKLLTSPTNKSDPVIIESISGKDDEINQQNTASSPTPAPVDMPFEITVRGSYTAIQTLVTTLSQSIRPFQIQSIEFSGNDKDLKAKIAAKTFYQPEKSLKIKTQDIK